MILWLVTITLLAVLQLVRVAYIHTSVLELTNPRYVTAVGIGMGHVLVHTRQVWLTQNDATQPSMLGLIAVTVTQ